MSADLPPSALVEALEKRAALKQYRVDELREIGGKNAVDEAAALELEAKELRAAAAFIRSTMDAFGCHAGRDGECNWAGCPQLRDGEPKRSGRHCPRDIVCGDPSCDAVERAKDALRTIYRSYR